MAWAKRLEREALQVNNIAMSHWPGEQRQFIQMDDAITNTAHFVAPNGRRYDLDARPRYQWLLPNGQTVGTDTPTPPGAGLPPLRRLPD